MYLDRLDKQDVQKRRSAHNVVRTQCRTAHSEAGFPQEVWPRRRDGTDGKARKSGSFDLAGLGQTVLDGIGAGRAEKRRKPAGTRSRTAGFAEGRNGEIPVSGISGDTFTDNASSEVRRIRIPRPEFAWPKFMPALPRPKPRQLLAVMGILAMGIVGPNWDNISSSFMGIRKLDPSPLADPVNPLVVRSMNADRTPAFSPGGAEYSLPAPDFPETDGSLRINLTETFSWTPYTVAPGDTISGIAARHSLSQGSIIALNDIRESWKLQSGKTIKIPNMDGIPYTVRADDTLGGIASRMGVPLGVLLDANDVGDPNLRVGQTLFVPGGKMDSGELSRAIRRPERPLIRPIPGRITSGYGWREDPLQPGSGRMEFHRALDLAGNTGDPVKAAMAGTVLHRSSNSSLGNFIIIQHGDHQTLYAHLSAFGVAVGQSVRQGQEIGKVGSTGRSTGPHLHFAVFRNGEPINPIDLLR